MVQASKPSRWPLILVATALVTLSLAAVGVGHLYWRGLTQGVDDMNARIASAREREHALSLSLQQANAALLAKADELDRQRAALVSFERTRAPGQPPPPRRNLNPEDWRALSDALQGLTQQTSALPVAKQPLWVSIEVDTLVREQLRTAGVAVVLEDSLLLDLSVTSAQRILLLAYGLESEPAMALAAELARLRASLRRIPSEAMPPETIPSE